MPTEIEHQSAIVLAQLSYEKKSEVFLNEFC